MRLRSFIPQGMRLRFVLAAFLGLLVPLSILNWIAFPLPKADLVRPHGAFIYSREGHLLNCFTSPDRFWRKPVKLAEISPLLVESVIATEDRWFYFHPGVNPIALIESAVANLRAGKKVRGGSTITMQIARMMEPKERTMGGKLIEICRAFQLELAYSKNDLLEIYFNLAPYGGNIEGVGAATWLYFGKRPDQLTLSEAAILTAIPSSPTQFRPDRDAAKCQSRRDRVLTSLQQHGDISEQDLTQALKEEIPEMRTAPVVAAPHFSQTIASLYRRESEIHSTLDYKTQVMCERIARNYQGVIAQKGVWNLSVVVIDNATGDLLAMVGSADFGDQSHQGQINGARAPRSPGSALKPFVYALAFDRGIITPATMLEDSPINYSGYIPVNYDEEYHGVVSAKNALINSFNVPAVNVAAQVGLRDFFDLLKRGGLTSLRKNYFEHGLPLILGACEIDLLELTNLYTCLARGGEYRDCRMVKDEAKSGATRLFSAESCYLISDILSQLQRPDLPTSWEFTPDLPKVAWKTGTSFGRKDAWAIGYDPTYTVGVWAGNFTAEGSAAIVGAEISTPLMMDIFTQLVSGRQKPWFPKPERVDHRDVCAVSGMPAGENCPQVQQDDFIVGVSSTRKCTVHKRILVDTQTGFQLCKNCEHGKKARERIIEIWPPRVATWLQRRGLLSLTPLHNPKCTGVAGGEDPIIMSPEPGAVYVIRNSAPSEFQKILFEASIGSDAKELHWFLDGELFSTTTTENRVFYAPTKGSHRLMCVDSYGRSSSVSFKVE